MNLTDTNDPPVTVDVMRQAKPGCEAEFERALADIIAAAEGFEGHLGANIFRSNDGGHAEYRIIFKFDHLSSLKRWEDAPIRARLLERVNRLTLGEGKLQILTGLETWFTLPAQKAIAPPPRYKMVLLSWIVIFPLSNVLPPLLKTVLAPLPSLLQGVISAFCMVLLMTYIVMPRVTKLFAPWLYPTS
ncbi:MAG: antibiotic biosynthesis monooxygenase [Thermosynechococcaceae cyanobacterium]